MKTAEILDLLDGVRDISGGWQAICPAHDDKEPSLSISNKDGKTLLHCHAGCSTAEIVKSLGIDIKDLFDEKKEVEKIPEKKQKIVKIDEKVVKYFEETRKIPKRILQLYNVRDEKHYCGICEKEVNCTVYNYLENGKIVNQKFVHYIRNKEKKLIHHFTQQKAGKQILWNIDNVKDKVIICEGENDALSFIKVGYEYATSVPSGAVQENTKDADKKMEFLANSKLDKVETVYIAVDNDVSGERLKKELIERLKDKTVFIVEYPKDCKDANEVLQKHGNERLVQAFKKAKRINTRGIYVISDIVEGVEELHKNDFPDGAKTGYSQFDRHFQFYPAMFTVISGYTTHGKSTWLDQILVKLMQKNDWKIALHSPENGLLEIHAKRLLEQISGNYLLPRYDTQIGHLEMMEILEYLNDHIYYIWNTEKMLTAKEILEKAKILVEEHGINALVVDPWNSIKHEKTQHLQYNAEVLNEFRYFARRENIHCIMVAHPRKAEVGKERTMPLIGQVSGADFQNVADNAIIVFRKYAEDGLRTLYTTIHVAKVKHEFIGKPGFIKFDYNVKGQRYTEQIEENEVKF